jgi:hypothetical protein
MTALIDLRPGYEAGDGSMDGAQLVDGEWWHPVHGCDSLQLYFDKLRRKERRKGGSGQYRIEQVEVGFTTYYRPQKAILWGLVWIQLDPDSAHSTYKSARRRILQDKFGPSKPTYLDPNV